MYLGHVWIFTYISMQLCNFLTQQAFYILFELCIFYLLLRSTAANVTCFNTLALSLSLSLKHTQRRSGWFLSWGTAVVVVAVLLLLLPFFAVNTAASSLLSIYVYLSHSHGVWKRVSECVLKCTYIHAYIHTYVDADVWTYECVCACGYVRIFIWIFPPPPH